MNAWEVYEADLGWGSHPVVIVSHPARAARKEFVEILDCSSQRASRPARLRGVVSFERRRQIVRTLIAAHGWNAL